MYSYKHTCTHTHTHIRTHISTHATRTRALQLSYLDLYLVHAPASAVPGPTVTPPLIDQWRVMEELHDKVGGTDNFCLF